MEEDEQNRTSQWDQYINIETLKGERFEVYEGELNDGTEFLVNVADSYSITTDKNLYIIGEYYNKYKKSWNNKNKVDSAICHSKIKPSFKKSEVKLNPAPLNKTQQSRPPFQIDAVIIIAE